MKNEYFEKITEAEWRILLKNIINIENKNISYITKKSPILKEKLIINSGNQDGVSYEYLENFEKRTRIIELKDEWFLIDNYHISDHYKCDQIDGVIECLKYLRFI